ncbi:MAG: TetR/AcrR family transcriptional regulator [Eubacterium sp.]|nr:TetR/AcrR family transcriptional regulator [Eubacterium sp.]
MKNDEVKKSIINATIEIIEKSDGDINNITARKIADKSGVALGLINYHFGSKENLIAQCSREIINEKLFGLTPDKIDYKADDGLSDLERLISFARQTFDYIYSNPSIAKISIISDFKDYDPKGNSSLTQKGFQMALRGDISEKKKKLIAFSFASIMQTAFLAGDNSELIMGYSLKSKKQRDIFISDVVTTLMNDMTPAS